MTGETAPRPPGWRRALPWIARLLVPVLFVVWFVGFADREAFLAALADIPAWSLAPAFALGGVAMSLGGVRWRLLMRALGARALPSVGTAVRVFYVGLFYNTFVPGSVGGDVVRGVVSRHNFEHPLASYLVVVLERLIGMTALGVVFLCGLLWGPDVIDLDAVLPWIGGLLALGVAVAVGAVASGRLARWWRRVPRVDRPADLIGVFALSALAHVLGVATVGVLVAGMGLPLGPAELAFVVPLASVAAVLPIALAGMGPREAALVGLLKLLGIPPEQGLALSLGVAAVSLGLALLGGVFQLVAGRLTTAAPDASQSP